VQNGTDCVEKDVSKKSSVVVCICCSGNMFTEPFPSNERGKNVQTHRLTGGIYEVCH
jgi:hypothetical protein